ncbi:MAG: DUF6549 family protein [Odoribacter sp.]
MKKYVVIAFFALIAALCIVWNMYTMQRAERKRFESNQDALLTENRAYKIRDSLNVVNFDRLVFDNRELKKYKGEAIRLIDDLNIKINRVQSITTAGTETLYEFKTVVIDSFIDVPVKIIEFKNNYVELSGVIKDKEFTGKIISRDTLVCVAHRVPRKIWFIKYGCKGVKMEIVCKNPNSRIVYPEYIELK